MLEKEALEYLVSLGEAHLEEVNGQNYSDKLLHLVKQAIAKPVQVQNLSAIVTYVKSDFDGTLNSEIGRLLIHIVDPTCVEVRGYLNSDAERDFYLRAQAYLPEFAFNHFYDVESFIIKLQSCFLPSSDRQEEQNDRSALLSFVGNIEEKDVKNSADDGVSQKIEVKRSVVNVELEKVPNPVILKPFRTFTEVEQPSSPFIFRLQNGPLSGLFEADGGAWRREAMANIKKYLNEGLDEYIQAGRVVIIA
ncbi:hypothetical protein [Sporolactobacillus sp. KGMB 08714]|uniref:hypothetical protein n=1 Tax=Sporolactobacillus sp. KGMB 08714 TaxID=3064704 RepID=UPI002FBDF8FC